MNYIVCAYCFITCNEMCSLWWSAVGTRIDRPDQARQGVYVNGVCVCSLSLRKFWSSVIFFFSSLCGFNISEIVPYYASINVLTCFWNECFVSFASSTSNDWQMIACNDVYEFCSTHPASRWPVPLQLVVVWP